jgi:hypothetical protein
MTASLFLFGCQKNYYDHIEDDIVGDWVFQKAEQQQQQAFKPYESMMDWYRNDEISFYEDKTVEYREANGDVLTGIWKLTSIHSHSNNDDESSTNSYTISIALSGVNGDLVQYTWTPSSLNYHCMRVYENQAEYNYRFVLDKL